METIVPCLARKRVLLILLALLMFSGEAFSIPVFARKYNLSCFTCHTGYPALNEFGLRFKGNGFQIPGTVEDTPIWDSNQLPIALSTHATYEDSKSTNHANVALDDISPEESVRSSGFSKPGVDVLAGGTLAKHVSFFFGMPIEDGTAEVEQAYVVLNNLLDSPTTWVNVKVGEMFLDSPYAENLAIPSNDYLTHVLSPVQDGFAVGEPQLGASVMGVLTKVGGGLRYEVGVFNGSNKENDNNTTKDFYLRLAPAIYVKNAPFRFSILIYRGKQTIGAMDSSFHRTGLSADIYDPWTKRVYLYSEYMWGKDDDTDAVVDGNQPFEFSGGFIGANVLIIPEKLILFTRYDRIHVTKEWDLDPSVRTDFGNANFVSSISFGARYFFIANVALQAEFSDQKNAIGYPVDSAARVISEDGHSFSVHFDFDF